MYLVNHNSRIGQRSAAFLGAVAALAYSIVFPATMATASMPAVASAPLPVGLILPVTMDQSISLDQAHEGQPIETRIAQDVPIASHDKIPRKSSVTGSIVSIVKSADGNYVDLSLRFDKIEYHKQMISMVTSLRAVASYETVRHAQIPLTGADSGTPTGWADTTQIGGDIRYGDSGQVRDLHKQVVGKGVFGGVLVHVRAAPDSDCEGPINGDDRLQAMWVFSSDACGVYGLPEVHITHSGRTAPIAVMTLRFEKANMKLDASTAFLLRVVSPN